MFIVCSNCDFKYLVNSADLKPSGRIVECANCGHQWFQKLDDQELTSTATSKNNLTLESNIIDNQNIIDQNTKIKNLPSTVVKEEKPSIRNSLIVIFVIFFIFTITWYSRSYGINTFVLIDFYISEFFFNLNLIISDLAKIINDTLN